MRLKYILDDYGNFAIFSDVNTHSDMARGFYREPVSAGFCTLAVGYKEPSKYDLGEEQRNLNIHCFGKSISLGLESREEDEKIINDKLNNIYG